MKKRLLSALLTLCFVLTMSPVAFAAGQTTASTESDAPSIQTLEELKNALSSASSGSTVTLTGNITINNEDITTAGAGIIQLPAGVTLDGNGNSIIIGNVNPENSRHVILIMNADGSAQTVIQNLTIVGGANTKSGIHAYQSKNVVLNNVTIENCANAGLLVNGSEVTATGLTTRGNTWGAVNVDKGAGVQTDLSFTMTGGSLAEDVQIWTELADSSITVTDGNYVSVVGQGGNLKGYTYYTSDVSKLGEASISRDGKTTVYSTLEDALSAVVENDTIDLLKNATIENPITIATANVTLNGGGKEITYASGAMRSGSNFITVTANNVTIKNAVINAGSTAKYGVHFYNNEGGKLSGVTVNGGAYSAVLVNGAKVSVEDSTLAPESGANANIEYGMGSGVTSVPSLTVNNVTGTLPMVWVDDTTITNIKNNTSLTDKQDILDEINKNITNESSDDFTIKVEFPTDQGGSTTEEIVSGGTSSGGSTKYAIRINGTEHGTVESSHITASRGTVVTLTVTPDEGYQLDTLTVTDSGDAELYVEDKGNGEYTFKMQMSSVTVKAVFVEKEEEEKPDTDFPFSDVNSEIWYHDAVKYVYDNGIMNGMTGSSFAPSSAATRGMTITALHRLAGKPSAAASDFNDVLSGSYYYDAVAWADENNIVNGISSDIFAPGRAITREQIAVILYRYAQLKGYDTSASGDLASYTDASQISSYAVEAMKWANAKGLITGVTGTTLNPRDNANRAEVATILMRFCENVVK